MKQHLYKVDMKHKETNERISLKVWAENTDEATHKIVNAIGGYRGEYEWRGTSPEYKNNQLVTRNF